MRPTPLPKSRNLSRECKSILCANALKPFTVISPYVEELQVPFFRGGVRVYACKSHPHCDGACVQYTVLNTGIGNSQFARDLVNLRVLGLGGAMSVVSSPDLGQQIINAARIHSAGSASPGSGTPLAAGRASQHRRPGDLSVPGAWAPCASLPLGRRCRRWQTASVHSGCARRPWTEIGEVDKGGWRAHAWTECAAKLQPSRRCHTEHGLTPAPLLSGRHFQFVRPHVILAVK